VTVLHCALAWAEALTDVCLAARGTLHAPMPSLVVEVRVAVGDRMEKGQAVVVLESMKMEMALRVPADGIIKAIGCVKGEMVEEGGELVDIEESEEYDWVGVFSTCCILSAKMVYYILVLVSHTVTTLLLIEWKTNESGNPCEHANSRTVTIRWHHGTSSAPMRSNGGVM